MVLCSLKLSTQNKLLQIYLDCMGPTLASHFSLEEKQNGLIKGALKSIVGSLKWSSYPDRIHGGRT